MMDDSISTFRATHQARKPGARCPAFEIKVARGDDFFTTSVHSSPGIIGSGHRERQHAYCRVGLAVV
jgi:hypothetical protein